MSIGWLPDWPECTTNLVGQEVLNRRFGWISMAAARGAGLPATAVRRGSGAHWQIGCEAQFGWPVANRAARGGTVPIATRGANSHNSTACGLGARDGRVRLIQRPLLDQAPKHRCGRSSYGCAPDGEACRHGRRDRVRDRLTKRVSGQRPRATVLWAVLEIWLTVIGTRTGRALRRETEPMPSSPVRLSPQDQSRPEAPTA